MAKRGRNASALAARNPYDFDERIRFDEEGHKYFVDGKRVFRSATAIIKAVFPSSGSFDADKVINSNLQSWRNNSSSKYFQLVQGKSDVNAVKAIKASWNRNRDLGTLLHKRIELALNEAGLDTDAEAEEILPELKQFHAWHAAATARGWRAVRTEFAVFYENSKGVKTCGQVDALYFDEQDRLRVIDHKRTDKELHDAAPNYGKFGIGVMENVGETENAKYGLQLHIYGQMLQQRIEGAVVGPPLLLQLHPDNEFYREICVPDFSPHARTLLESQ
jgi:hypothetical protein